MIELSRKQSEDLKILIKRLTTNDFEANKNRLRRASVNLFYRNESKSDCDRFDLIIFFIDECSDQLIEEIRFYLESNMSEIIIEIKSKSIWIGTTTDQSFYDYHVGIELDSEEEENEQSHNNETNAPELSRKYYPNTRRLSSLQRQQILMNLLQNLRFNPKQSNDENNRYQSIDQNPQHNHPVDENDSGQFPTLLNLIGPNGYLLEKLNQSNLIEQLLLLHDDDDLNHLKKTWVAKIFASQPLDEICSYFGTRIAIYFAFIGFYNYHLQWPTCFGLLITLFPTILDYLFDMIDQIDLNFLESMLIFLSTLFNIYWSTTWLREWDFFCGKLSTKWSKFKPPIVDHHRKASKKHLSKHFDRSHSNQSIDHQFDWFTNINLLLSGDENFIMRYFVTFPIITILLIVSFMIMFQIFEFQNWWDTKIVQTENYPEMTSFVPKILFAICLNIINHLYYIIVIWLNDKERYQSNESKENQLVLKLFLFQFLNFFLPLFYIGFYLKDMNKLREQLATQLIVRQVFGNLLETLWPFLKESIRLAFLSHNFNTKFSAKQSNLNLNPSNRHKHNLNLLKNNNYNSKELNEEHLHLSKAELESCLDPYESTFDDYLELIIQYGYVMLFAPIFPLAPLCAIFNNLIEIRSDAFKLCYVFQRTYDNNQSRSLGVWIYVLNFLNLISIMSNAALMVVSGHLNSLLSFIPNNHSILAGVVIEHLMLLFKWTLPLIIQSPHQQLN